MPTTELHGYLKIIFNGDKFKKKLVKVNDQALTWQIQARIGFYVYFFWGRQSFLKT